MGCVATYEEIEIQKLVKKNKKVQGQKQNNQTKIRICSAKLGKNISPFEYFLYNSEESKQHIDLSRQQQELNIVMKRVWRIHVRAKKIYKNRQQLTQSKVRGTISQQKLQRYTPLKNQNAGVKSKNALMTTQQFQSRWIQQTKIKQQLRLRQFDLACYHAIVAYVYQVKGKMSIDEIKESYLTEDIDPKAHLDNIVTTNLSIRYQVFMKAKFADPTFSIKQKIKKLFYFIDKHSFHIVFLQEIPEGQTEFIKTKLKSYRMVGSQRSSTAILIDQKLSQQLELKETNLTLHGHNSRYLASDILEDLKKKQSVNQTRNQTMHPEAVKVFLGKLKKICSSQPESNKKKKENAQSKPQNAEAQTNKYVMVAKEPLQISLPKPEETEQKEKPVVNQSGPILPKILDQSKFIEKLALETAKVYKTIRKQSRQLRTQTPMSQKQDEVQRSSMIRKTNSFGFEFKQSTIEQDTIEGSTFDTVKNSIILKKEVKVNPSQIKQLGRKFQWVCQFIGCLILISAQGSFEETKQLKTYIQQVTKKYPHHIVIAGLNLQPKRIHKKKLRDQMKYFRNQDEKEKRIHFAPNIFNAIPGFFQDETYTVDERKLKKFAQKKGMFTNFNKKTSFNFNEDDHEHEYIGVDNFLLSTEQLSEHVIKACNNETINEFSSFCTQRKYIPNTVHPFADFFVCAEMCIELKQVVEGKPIFEQHEESQSQDQENQQKQKA